MALDLDLSRHHQMGSQSVSSQRIPSNPILRFHGALVEIGWNNMFFFFRGLPLKQANYPTVSNRSLHPVQSWKSRDHVPSPFDIYSDPKYHFWWSFTVKQTGLTAHFAAEDLYVNNSGNKMCSNPDGRRSVWWDDSRCRDGRDDGVALPAFPLMRLSGRVHSDRSRHINCTAEITHHKCYVSEIYFVTLCQGEHYPGRGLRYNQMFHIKHRIHCVYFTGI